MSESTKVRRTSGASRTEKIQSEPSKQFDFAESAKLARSVPLRNLKKSPPSSDAVSVTSISDEISVDPPAKNVISVGSDDDASATSTSSVSTLIQVKKEKANPESSELEVLKPVVTFDYEEEEEESSPKNSFVLEDDTESEQSVASSCSEKKDAPHNTTFIDDEALEASVSSHASSLDKTTHEKINFADDKSITSEEETEKVASKTPTSPSAKEASDNRETSPSGNEMERPFHEVDTSPTKTPTIDDKTSSPSPDSPAEKESLYDVGSTADEANDIVTMTGSSPTVNSPAREAVAKERNAHINAIVQRSKDEEDPVLKVLEDRNICFHIVEYLGPINAAAVGNKLFFEVATQAAESALDKFKEKYQTTLDWRLRLMEHVLDRYKHFYFGDGDGAAIQHPKPPIINPRMHPRLCWQAAYRVPLVHFGEFIDSKNYGLQWHVSSSLP